MECGALNRPIIREVIVVEGRYDKNAVLQAVDAMVVETGGFGVFSRPEQKTLLRRLQLERGLIVLTDGDGAGFLIRNHIKGVMPYRIKQAYVPGAVEDAKPCAILDALVNAGATVNGVDTTRLSANITKADLYADGLSGRPDSAAKRAALLKTLNLPERMTASAMLAAINILLTREEYLAAVRVGGVE
jgi:ribonuclease M5